MKLLVFGATGGTGRELVKQALDAGHFVSAYVRDPAKIKDLHERLRVDSGDVLDSAAVSNSVAGQDAIFSTIGAGASRSTLREEGTRNIVEFMQETGVKRLVSLSSLGVGDSRSNLPFFTKYIIVAIFLRHAFADHERQEAVIKQSSLDWTIVRPPHLKDGPRMGVYRHGFSSTDRRIKGWISRADVAEFMLSQLEDDRYLHKTPGVSY
ncbi:MAG: SDR family oxidoreductase [Pirellulales bacterium]|nr:SDR family oxidoreductase [Pirellulales bacterium]